MSAQNKSTSGSGVLEALWRICISILFLVTFTQLHGYSSWVDRWIDWILIPTLSILGLVTVLMIVGMYISLLAELEIWLGASPSPSRGSPSKEKGWSESSIHLESSERAKEERNK